MTKLAFMGHSNKWVFIVGGSHACIQQADAVLLFWLWFFLLPNLILFLSFLWASLSRLPNDSVSFSIFCPIFFQFWKQPQLISIICNQELLIYIPVFKNLFKHLSHALCFCYTHLNTPLSAKKRLWYYTWNLFLYLHIEIHYILYIGYSSKS